MDNHEGNDGSPILSGDDEENPVLQWLDPSFMPGGMGAHNGGADSFVQVPPLQVHQLRHPGNCGVRGGVETLIQETIFMEIIIDLFKEHFFFQDNQGTIQSCGFSLFTFRVQKNRKSCGGNVFFRQ